MPNIREFSAPEGLSLRPSSVGTDAAAAAGRRIGGFYNQRADALTNEGQRIGRGIGAAGEAVDQHITHQEILRGAPLGTQMGANLDDDWNATIKGGKNADGTDRPPADPNDSTVKEKWRQEVLEPKLQQFVESFNTVGGQKFAEGIADRYRDHFFLKTSADMATLAKQQVTQSVDGFRNNLANMTFADPSSLDANFGILEHSTNAIVGSSAVQGAQGVAVNNELQEQGRRALVRAAVQGTIRNGGDYNRIVNDPRYSKYVDGAEAATFAKAAQVQNKAFENSTRAAVLLKKQENMQAGSDALAKNFTDNVSYDNSGNPIIKPQIFANSLDVVRQYPEVADHARTLINWAESQQREHKPNIVTDPSTMKDLYDGLFSADNPTTEVDLMKAQVAHKLSNQDFAQLHQLQKALEERPLRGPVWQGTMEGVKGALGTDPVGHEQYAKFVQTFIPDYIRLSRAGTLPPNALDVRDPESMISKAMAPYKRSPMQQMLDRKSYGLLTGDDIDPNAIRAKTGVTPTQVRQNGHTYQRQPDGTYKPIDDAVSVKTPEEARALKPGTRYTTPDGKVMIR